MTEKFICPICGDPTSSYMGKYRKDKLCRKHASDLKDGDLILCDECHSYHRIFEACKNKKSLKKNNEPISNSIEREKQSNGKCIVCGEDAPNGSLCRDCYYEMLDYKDSFDKNSRVFELKDHYFNLRSNIYRMKTFDYIQSNCNKLMALAVLTKNLFGEQSLTDRVINDIQDIIEKKKPKDEQPASEYSKTQDSRKEEVLRTQDGHYVKSDPECIIDDILYDLRIVHCYEKRVHISADEQALYCDWFIPVKSSREGIYIEYWGKKTQEYLQNKERKRRAYKEHNIPLIEIEKDDYTDRRGLEDRLLSEINMHAKNHFGINDFLK